MSSSPTSAWPCSAIARTVPRDRSRHQQAGLLLAPLRPHDLRHTAVALWIAAGASPKEVAARAEHTSVSFALDRYGHLFPEADTALRARLDSLFRAATEHRRNTVA